MNATAPRTKGFLSVMLCALLMQSLFLGSASAQLRASSGLDLSLQAGVDVGLGQLHSGSLDASLTALLPLSNAFDLVAGIGYQKVGQTDNAANEAETITNIPAFAGLRFNFDVATTMPYIGGEFSLNDLVYHATNGVQSIPDVAKTRLGYAIVAGTRIPFSAFWAADISVKYHDLPTSGSYPDTQFISVVAGLVVHLDI